MNYIDTKLEEISVELELEWLGRCPTVLERDLAEALQRARKALEEADTDLTGWFEIFSENGLPDNAAGRAVGIIRAARDDSELEKAL